MKQSKMPMLTLRIPRALHLALKELAHEKRLSMNRTGTNALLSAILQDQRSAEVWRVEQGKEVVI